MYPRELKPDADAHRRSCTVGPDRAVAEAGDAGAAPRRAQGAVPGVGPELGAAHERRGPALPRRGRARDPADARAARGDDARRGQGRRDPARAAAAPAERRGHGPCCGREGAGGRGADWVHQYGEGVLGRGRGGVQAGEVADAGGPAEEGAGGAGPSAFAYVRGRA